MAPLIANLRGQFAEFLNNASPDRLRILSSPTCVGLRYGHLKISIEAFLDSVESASSLLKFRSPSLLRINVKRDLPLLTPYQLRRTQPTVR